MNGNSSILSDNSHSENESVPLVDIFKCSKTLCIFCANEVPPAFVIERGKLMRVKEEMELNSFGCDNFILAKQLRAINIVRNILDISDGTCIKLLGQFDGQFNPEFWVKLCSSCKIFVEDFNSTRREIVRLEKKSKHLKEKLKGFILMSSQDEDLVVNSSKWSEIREEVVAGLEQTSQQNEPQVDMQMEVEVEPEFRVKTEILDEPRSFAREKRSPTENAKIGKTVTISKLTKPGTATQIPTTTERNIASKAYSVELSSEPEKEMGNDEGTESIITENESPNAAANEDGSLTNIIDMPFRVLERIFSYLEEKDWLNCRAVRSEWKEAVSRVTEQKLISFFTKWHNKKAYSDLGLNTLIPALWINIMPRNPKANPTANRTTHINQLMRFVMGDAPVYNPDGQAQPENYSKLFCPPGIFGSGAQNPFPSSALRFGMRSNEFHFYFVPPGWEEREIYPFFKNYGHFLTTFVLDGYREHAKRFAELLSHLPNLKSLTLEAVQLHGGDAFNWSMSTLPSLPHLTHLHCKSTGYSVRASISPQPFFWILEKFSAQLIGLTVSGFPYLFTKDVDKMLTSKLKAIQFGKLKQLKVNTVNKAIIQLTQGANLSHIMVNSYLEDKESLRVILPLIESFSKTIESLRLPVQLGELGQNDGTFLNFPKVKQLAIRAPTKSCSETLWLKRFLQTRFCEVENLEFVHYFGADVHSLVDESVKAAEYWKLLPKLKTITTFDDQPDDDDYWNKRSFRSIHERTHLLWNEN